MKPKFLQMKNFGPYEQAEIDFEKFYEVPLFLISGKTGAGKTTIFDGMCYALFGETSGGLRKAEEMRSNFATPTALTEVYFEFYSGEKRYTISRRPKQLLPKKKGEGLVERPAKVTLTIYNQAQKAEAEYTKAGEVNQRITEILHLNARQFCQIVLLPQGEFRRFLDADSNEKERLLRKLFGTEFYEKLTETLKQRVKALGKNLESEERLLRSQLVQLQFPEETQLDFQTLTIPESLEIASHKQQSLLGELEDKRSLQQTMEKERQILETEIAKQQSLIAYHQEQVELQAKQEVWRQKADAIAELRQDLTVQEWCQSQEPKIMALKKEQQTLDKWQAKQSEVQSELKKQHLSLVAAQKQLELLDEQQSQQKQLEIEIGRMEIVEPQFLNYLESQQQVANLQQAVNTAAVDVKGLTAEINRLQSQSATLQAQADLSRHQLLEEETQQKQALMSQTWQLQIEKLLEKSQLLQQFEAALAVVQQQIEANQIAYEQAKTAYKVEKSFVASQQIARLSLDLLPGMPCPVCGSLEHPAKAEHVAYSLEAMLAAEAKLEQTEKEYQEKMATRHHLAEKQEQLRFDIEESQKLNQQTEAAFWQSVQTATFFQALPPCSYEGQDLAILYPAVRRFQKEVKQSIAQLQKVKQNLQETNEKMQQAQRNVTENQQQLVMATTKMQSLKEEFAAETAQMATLKTQIADDWGDYPQFRQLLQTKKAGLQQYQNALKAAQMAFQNTQQTIQLLENDAKHYANERDNSQSSLQQLQLELAAALKQAPKPMTEAELTASLTTGLELAKWRQEIEAYERQGALFAQRLEELAVLIQGQPRPDLTEKRAELTDLQERLADFVKDVHQLEFAHEQNQQLLQTLQMDYEKLKTAWKDWSQWQKMAAVASGDIASNKLGIERFVLQHYLEEILATANQRLKSLSYGRYQFVLKTQTASWKSRSGLEIDVYDDNVGSQRSVSTLSGGESFIAALSLSLALGEVIQNHAGGIAVEALFIDEGFGALDEDALNLALTALESLEASGRMIGIISHVKELKAQIPTQIQVLALGNGRSTIR